MFVVNNLIGFGAGGGLGPKTLTWVAVYNTGTNATDYSGSFDGISVGAAQSDRYVIVGVGGHRASGSPNSITSVTISGVSATKVVESISADATMSSLWIANVPTGSTVDIDVVWGVGQGRMGIAVWYATGLSAGTAVDSGGSTADPATDTLTTSSDGFGVGYAFTNDAGTATWTGFTEETSSDEQIEGVSNHSAASTTTNGSNVSPSCDYSGSNANRAGVFATF